MMKALIVDDSKAMRRLLSAYVADHIACETIEADDGLSALARLEEHSHVDVALVDWDMPRMSGIDFVRAVRADARFDGMKLLMVTAHNEPEDLVEAMSDGADDFLMKPLDGAMIAEKLRILGFGH